MAGICKACDGTGRCSECHGIGSFPVSARAGEAETRRPCSTCRCTAQCQACQGRREVKAARSASLVDRGWVPQRTAVK